MPHEGNVQIALVTRTLTGGVPFGAAFEVGSRGEAVKIIAIHYSVGRFFGAGTLTNRLKVALSTNPEHALSPPATEGEFMNDKALYGAISVGTEKFIGAPGVEEVGWVTSVIPLHGIIRPRRQIIVGFWISQLAANFRAEVYYIPVQMNKTELDALNLKYGKYRRGA